jgi:hypothetical protein
MELFAPIFLLVWFVLTIPFWLFLPMKIAVDYIDNDYLAAWLGTVLVLGFVVVTTFIGLIVGDFTYKLIF